MLDAAGRYHINPNSLPVENTSATLARATASSRAAETPPRHKVLGRTSHLAIWLPLADQLRHADGLYKQLEDERDTNLTCRETHDMCLLSGSGYLRMRVVRALAMLSDCFGPRAAQQSTVCMAARYFEI